MARPNVIENPRGVSLRLPAVDVAEVKQIAEERRVTDSEVYRDAVSLYLSIWRFFYARRIHYPESTEGADITIGNEGAA